VCEACGTIGDTDNDTICDDVDICNGTAIISGSGNDLIDQDGDGIPDDCDMCPL
jgi:hypothetical protein